MICSFFGHGDFNEYEKYQPILYNILKKLIIENDVTTFYNGGYGGFDNFACRCVNEIKQEFPHITNTIVVAYRDDSHLKKYEQHIKKYACNTIYPFERKILPRYAIIERNKWIINKSDYVISFVRYSWGGAALAIEYALKKRKNIISLI